MFRKKVDEKEEKMRREEKAGIKEFVFRKKVDEKEEKMRREEEGGIKELCLGRRLMRRRRR